MPFKSKAQETYLQINEPEIYKRWKKRYGLYKEAETFTPQLYLEVYHLMETFESKGYEILLVGGVVRDTLLGYTPADFDFSTNATPDEVAKLVDSMTDYKYIRGAEGAQAKRALTSLVLSPSGEVFEITTFRAELGYEDGNRALPIAVPAKTFAEDASRRDITINSMGMDKEGKIYDPMEGLKDLNAGIIRGVGNPADRFTEDPLRMIRAIRYSVRFGFPMDSATEDAIVENVELVKSLSSKRLRTEIGKVLYYPDGFRRLMETGILPTLMPEFQDIEQYEHQRDYHPEGNLYNHYVKAFDTFTQQPTRTEMGAWALLFHDIAKPATAEWTGEHHTFKGHDGKGRDLILRKYNNKVGPFEFSKKELQALAWTTEHHLNKFWDMKKPLKVAEMANNPHYSLLLEVVGGDSMGGHDEKLAKRLQIIQDTKNEVNTRQSLVGARPEGFALRVFEELDVPAGRERGEVMAEIERKVSAGEASDYEDALEQLKSQMGAEFTPFVDAADITLQGKEFDDDIGRMVDTYTPLEDPSASKQYVGQEVYDRFRRKGVIIDEGYGKTGPKISHFLYIINLDGVGFLEVANSMNYYQAFDKFDPYGILIQRGDYWVPLADDSRTSYGGLSKFDVKFPIWSEDGGPDFSRHNWQEWTEKSPEILEEWMNAYHRVNRPEWESHLLLKENPEEYDRRRLMGMYGKRECDMCGQTIVDESMAQLRIEKGMDSEIYSEVICNDCAEEEGNDEWTWLWEHIEEELRDADKREAALEEVTRASESLMTKLSIPTEKSWWIGQKVMDVTGRQGVIVDDFWAKSQGMKSSGLLNWIAVSEGAGATHRVWRIKMEDGDDIEVSNPVSIFHDKQLFDPHGIVFYDSRDEPAKGLRKKRKTKWVPLSAHPKTAYGVDLEDFDLNTHGRPPQKVGGHPVISPAFTQNNMIIDLETRNRVFGDRHTILPSDLERWREITPLADKHPYFCQRIEESVMAAYLSDLWYEWLHYNDSYTTWGNNPKPPLATIQQEFIDYRDTSHLWDNMNYDIIPDTMEAYIEEYYRTPAELQDMDVDMSFSDEEDEVTDIITSYERYAESYGLEWIQGMWDSENSSSRAETLDLMLERLPNETVADWRKRRQDGEVGATLQSILYTTVISGVGLGLGWYLSKKYLG